MLLSYGRYWNKSLYHQRSPRWRSAKLKQRKNLLSLLSSRIQIFGNLKDSQDDKKVKIFTTSCISDLCQSQMREVGTYWGWINRNWGWDARRRCWIGPRGWGCRPPPPRSSGHIDNWGTHTTGRRVQIQMCRYWLSNVVGTVNVVVLAHEKRHLRLRATSLLWVRENHLGQCFFANNTQEDAIKVTSLLQRIVSSQSSFTSLPVSSFPLSPSELPTIVKSPAVTTGWWFLWSWKWAEHSTCYEPCNCQVIPRKLLGLWLYVQRIFCQFRPHRDLTYHFVAFRPSSQ